MEELNKTQTNGSIGGSGKTALVVAAVFVIIVGLSAVGYFWRQSNGSEEANVSSSNSATVASETKTTVAVEDETEEEETSSDSDFVVDVYNKKKAYDGTTLFYDSHESEKPRIVEVDMNGKIVWEYVIPSELKNGSFVGVDAELLQNDNFLIVLSSSGVYEIDRGGNIVWSYSDPEVSHDADRLPNGNTLVVFGNNDKKTDAQVKEVDSNGKIVWEWSAKNVYGSDPRFKDSKMDGGWTHANAAQRLADGTTMISLRNFFMTVIVNKAGKIVKEYDWSEYGDNVDPHEPEFHEDDETLLVCLQNDARYTLVEINAETEEVVWTYDNPRLRTPRDGDVLPNGNILLVAVDNGGTGNNVNMEDDISVVLEITPDGEIVWSLKLDASVGEGPGWFYKAERIGS